MAMKAMLVGAELLRLSYSAKYSSGCLGFIFTFAAQEGGHLLCTARLCRKRARDRNPKKAVNPRLKEDNYKPFNIRRFELCYKCYCNDENYEYHLR